MNDSDEGTLQGLIDEKLLSEDTIRRIKAVRKAEKSLPLIVKCAIIVSVLVLMCAGFGGIAYTAWVPVGVRASASILAIASGIACVASSFSSVCALQDEAMAEIERKNNEEQIRRQTEETELMLRRIQKR